MPTDNNNLIISTADKLKASIYGKPYRRYIINLPDDFRCEDIVHDTEFNVDICHKIYFRPVAQQEDSYNIVNIPLHDFNGHIGNSIFENLSQRVCSGGAEVIFLIPPSGDSLALCMGLMKSLLEPGGYISEADAYGYSLCSITLPKPVGYGIGKLDRLKASGNIIRWTSHVEYGIEPIWKTVRSAVTSSLYRKKIINSSGDSPILIPFLQEKFLYRCNVVPDDPDFLRGLKDDTEKFVLAKFTDNAEDLGKGQRDDILQILRRMESWVKSDDIKSWLAIPGSAMLEVYKSMSSFAGQNSISLIDSDGNSGWPAAFSIKFGKGALSVYPGCVGVEEIISPEECGLRGMQYENDGTSTIENTSHSNESSPDILTVTLTEVTGSVLKDKLLNTKEPVFRVKINFDSKPEDKEKKGHLVSGAAFLKFLVIWHASKVGDGIAFLPGQIKRFKDRETQMKSSGYEFAMMKIKGKKKLEHLAGGSLFYEGPPSNIQGDDVNDTIYKILFNVRDAKELSMVQKTDLEKILRRKINTKKAEDGDENIDKVLVKLKDKTELNYSVEKLDGIKVIIRRSLFNNLTKVSIGESIRGREGFNVGKDKDSFYKSLKKFIQFNNPNSLTDV